MMEEIAEDEYNLPPVAIARCVPVKKKGDRIGSGYAKTLSPPMIMEVFCPPRFSQKARLYGIQPSLSFDLKTGWDLNNPFVIDFMWQMINKLQPLMIFTSPRCGSFSTLSNLNKEKL